MSDASLSTETVAIARATEQIRQEQETFDQLKSQDRLWFRLRISLGMLAAILIPSVFVASLVMVWSKSVPDDVRLAAATALVADVLALGATVWKVVLAPGSTDRLSPVTVVEPPPVAPRGDTQPPS
jgi:hypothetical protein